MGFNSAFKGLKENGEEKERNTHGCGWLYIPHVEYVYIFMYIHVYIYIHISSVFE
jgi:hypothetical protein